MPHLCPDCEVELGDNTTKCPNCGLDTEQINDDVVNNFERVSNIVEKRKQKRTPPTPPEPPTPPTPKPTPKKKGFFSSLGGK